MHRSADYTIKGFLYQFNKTLLTIFDSPDDSEITVEGVIEDVEVANQSGITAIQCKYHEAQEQFAVSTIYKPILQMMKHFCDNPGCQIRYILYAHFPGKCDQDGSPIGKEDLLNALNSKNDDLAKIIAGVTGRVNIDEFFECFGLQFGPSYDELVNKVCAALKCAGIPESDIDTLAYPNAIHFVALLSTKHDECARKVTKTSLLRLLKSIRQTAISRWTLALNSRKKILDAKRRQLKRGLDINTRLRYFVVFGNSLADFTDDIVLFIDDYLAKYHYKQAHIKTPMFCLDAGDDQFKQIHRRLHSKGITCETGMIADEFDPHHFFRQPMVSGGRQKPLQREFDVRIVRWESHQTVLNQHKPDDLFLLGDGDYSNIDQIDVNCELLAASTLREIRYMLGISDAYE